MRFAVGEAYDGALLRSFLKKEVGISTALLSRLKNHEQGILQNGKRVTVRAVLRQGDVIDLAVEDETPNEKVVPEATAVEVLFENSDLAVLNKPPFMATHPSSGHYTGTLANALVHRYGGNFHARFINRLDRNTSGVVLVAKNALSAGALSGAMAAGNMQKTYFAVVEGELQSPGRIDADIRRKPDSIMLRETCPKGEGDASLTLFEPVFADREYTLLRLTPKTGRTHQLRVHLASIGHPILGDELYGKGSALISRQALHAARLCFPLPGSGEPKTVVAPFPGDLRALFERKGWEVRDCEP